MCPIQEIDFPKKNRGSIYEIFSSNRNCRSGRVLFTTSYQISDWMRKFVQFSARSICHLLYVPDSEYVYVEGNVGCCLFRSPIFTTAVFAFNYNKLFMQIAPLVCPFDYLAM